MPPEALPPWQQYDHAIALEPGASPVNSCLYRYSPLQKDDIEQQAQEMLNAGLIRPSMSSYASSVLLVQKKMGAAIFASTIAASTLSQSTTNFPCRSLMNYSMNMQAPSPSRS